MELMRKNGSTSSSLEWKWEIWYYSAVRIHSIAWIQMGWKWDDVYLPRGLPNVYSPSLSPPPLPLYLRIAAVAHYQCTWRPGWSKLREALGGRDRVISEMHLEVRIEWTQRYTLRPWSSEFSDALAGYDRARLQKYLEAVDLEGGVMAVETLFIGYLVIVEM